jgi:molybdate transport system substrate-binding protein
VIRALALVLLAVAAAMTAPLAAGAGVTVFAAASLKDALDAAGQQYRQRHGEDARMVYAASSALAKQIENGAPADVFISADLDWMDYLARRHLLRPGSRVDLLRNEIVLVAPGSSSVKADIRPGFPLATLLGRGRLAIADPDSVPAGRYAKASLQKLGVWASVSSRLARAENVRAALAFVSRGEAPLGIVYRTDAAADPGVHVVGVFPSDTHPPIVYPAAVLAASRAADAARFLDFFRSPAAGAIFRQYGFMPY